MQHRSHIGAIIVLGVAVAAVCAIALIAAQPAQAQCGSQASSCKNCHETQGKMPVNNDGTGWHGPTRSAISATSAMAGTIRPLMKRRRMPAWWLRCRTFRRRAHSAIQMTCRREPTCTPPSWA